MRARRPSTRPSRCGPPGAGPSIEGCSGHPCLLEQALRVTLAERLGWPPFRVAPNSLLIRLATDRPATPAAFASLEGVNAERAEFCGRPFLDALARECGAVGLPLGSALSPMPQSQLQQQQAGPQSGGGSGSRGAAPTASASLISALRSLPLMTLGQAAAAVELSVTATDSWGRLFGQKQPLAIAMQERGLVASTFVSHVAAGIDKGLIAALQSPDALPVAAAVAGAPPRTVSPRQPHQRKCTWTLLGCGM